MRHRRFLPAFILIWLKGEKKLREKKRDANDGRQRGAGGQAGSGGARRLTAGRLRSTAGTALACREIRCHRAHRASGAGSSGEIGVDAVERRSYERRKRRSYKRRRGEATREEAIR